MFPGRLSGPGHGMSLSPVDRQPFGPPGSFRSGIASLEHLFGPAGDVFVTRRPFIRFDLRVHQNAAGIPSTVPSEAYSRASILYKFLPFFFVIIPHP
jgi:hypothetical protein